MAITWPSPITGAPQTGFTSPTYTNVADTAPPGNPGKQVAVTALGGTQAGVTTHSVASPFTLNFTRPASPVGVSKPNSVTGVIGRQPMNVYKVIARKGVIPLAGQAPQTMIGTIILEVPAGADLADPSNVRACISALFGGAWAMSAGIGDTTVTAIL